MNSYYRRCRSCNALIQLRRMPSGQWVAFEGYDTPHVCAKPGKSRADQRETNDTRAPRERPDDVLAGIGFDQVEIRKVPESTARKVASVPTRKVVEEKRRPAKPPRPKSPEKRGKPARRLPPWQPRISPGATLTGPGAPRSAVQDTPQTPAVQGTSSTWGTPGHPQNRPATPSVISSDLGNLVANLIFWGLILLLIVWSCSS